MSTKELIPKAARNEAGMCMLMYEKCAVAVTVRMLNLNNETKAS